MSSSIFDKSSDEDNHESRSEGKAAIQPADNKIQSLVSPILIYVITPGGNSIAVEIKSSENIQTIKNKIKDAEGIPTHPWILFFAGTQLEENKTLANYNIGQNSTLKIGFHFSEGAHILVQELERSFTVEISKFDTLHDMQSKIQDKMGYPPDHQRFIFCGKQFKEDSFIVHQMDMSQAEVLKEGIWERYYAQPVVHLVLRLRGGGNTIYHTPVWDESCTTESNSSNGNGDEVSGQPPFPQCLPPESRDASQIKIGSSTKAAIEHADATTDMNSRKLLSIKPQELKFLFEPRKQMSCTLRLTNTEDNSLAFNVKTSKPQKYLIRPHHGVMSPHSTCQVTVTMQAQQEAPPELKCEDRFLIQSLIVSPETTTKDFDNSLFENAEITQEYKLKVVYILPSQPPSVVSQETMRSSLQGLSISGNRTSNDSNDELQIDAEYQCFVGGLAWATDDQALEKAFSAYGEIINSKIINDRETGRSRGFGFVTFANEASMKEAIEHMNGQSLDGRNITVNKAQFRGSGGGGGGGGYRGSSGGGGGGRREGSGGGYGGGHGGYGGRREGGGSRYSRGGGGGSCYSRGGGDSEGGWRS